MKIYQEKIRKLLKTLILFTIGGSLYVIIEMIYRNHTHWTMFILGGLCFYCIGLINEILSWKIPLLLQSVIGACIITILEFLTGCIVNIWLKWNIWDYSNMPLNLFGQVCLPFSLLWILLSIVAIILDDYLRYYMFLEEKPRYTLIKWGK